MTTLISKFEVASFRHKVTKYVGPAIGVIGAFVAAAITIAGLISR
jgi:hypothetical protein